MVFHVVSISQLTCFHSSHQPCFLAEPTFVACEMVLHTFGHEAVILMEAFVDRSVGGALRSMRFLRSLRALRAVTAGGQGESR